MDRLIPQLPNTSLSNHGREIQTVTDLNFVITGIADCLERKMNDSDSGHTETSPIMKDYWITAWRHFQICLCRAVPDTIRLDVRLHHREQRL